LGNQFLANIRECEAIIHVLRCFDNGNIVHVEGSVDPLRDKEIIDIELQLKDLETVGKAVEKAKKFIKSGKKEDILTYETLQNLQKFLKMVKMQENLQQMILRNQLSEKFSC
jgi:ribosome-binding ATPase YchF (GTP1/OBG family)